MLRYPQLHRGHISRRSAENGADRSGAVTLEAVLAIPLLVFVVMAAFEFGTLAIVHQAMTAAVTEGAREASKVPTTVGALDGNRVLAAAEDAVYEILATQGIAPANVQLIVEDSDTPGDAALNGVRSSGPLVGAVPLVTTVTSPAEVQLTLRVELANTSIPNVLATFGLTLLTRNFDVCSVSRRDCI